MKKNGILLMVAINLGAAMVAVLAFAAWKRLNPEEVNQGLIETHTQGSTAVGFYLNDIDDVGFIAGANKRITAKKMDGSRVLYEVGYTTGPDHFRVVPEASQAERCVLLFGDSFTFGIGVNDDETFAAQIVSKSQGRVAAKNLAIGGWGPHQFLAGVQSGRFQRAVHCKPTDAIFLMIPPQIWRVVGVINPWDTKGPRYRMDAQGKLFRDGTLGDPDPYNWRRWMGLNSASKETAMELTKAVILEGMRKLKESYPGIRTHFISYHVASRSVIDFTPDDMLRFEDGLQQAGLTPLPLEAIIPRVRYFERDYVLDSLDPHPNVLAHRLIAEFILREIRENP